MAGSPLMASLYMYIVVCVISTVFAAAPHGMENIQKPTSLSSASYVHQRGMLATQQRMTHVQNINSQSVPRYQGSASVSPLRSVSPTDFGGDPSGKTDSTDAIMKALAAMLNSSSHADVPMASGIANLGGATLDLTGGEYLISKPVQIPTFVGNVRIQGGTLRASPTFPADRYLIEIGDANCTAKDSQGVCNEFIGVENIFLDGSHVAAGGIQVSKTMGTTIGPSAFVTGFNTIGILINQGHETMVLDAWLAEYFWSDPDNHNKHACEDGHNGSIGIAINGEDNYLENVIIFDFTCLGVLVNGAASILQGVHSWNGGGMAISINGSYDVQDRVVACYLDYSTLDIVNPNMITVTDTFFYNAHAVLHGTVVKNLVMRENIYSLNQYGGNQSIVLADGGGGGGGGGVSCHDVVVEDPIDAEQGKGVANIVTTVHRQSLYQKASKKWTFDFTNQLLFSNIEQVEFSLTLDQGEPLVMSAARAPQGYIVVVETSEPVSATVSITVRQCVA